MMNENLTPNVRAFAAERQLLIAESLGSGKGGIVLVGISTVQQSPWPWRLVISR
jgi:hypothetical protein